MADTLACFNPNLTVVTPDFPPCFPLSRRASRFQDHNQSVTIRISGPGKQRKKMHLHTCLEEYKPIREHCDTSRRPRFPPDFLHRRSRDCPRAEDLFSRVAFDTADPGSPTNNLANDSPSHARPSDLSVRRHSEFGPLVSLSTPDCSCVYIFR